MHNLIIRPTKVTDAQGFVEALSDPDVYGQLLQLPKPNLSVWQKRLADIPDNVHSFVAELDSQIVGNIALTVKTNPRQRHTGQFGMFVKSGLHGKGIGSALMATIIDLADNWLNLTRLELTVYTDNEKAIKLYQNFGFVIEGEAVDFAFRNGQFVNAYYMARIAKGINQTLLQ
ncbi:MAG: GNAT family N-acetyltransferase [Moraxella sp.]|nr:GNAT family N-acetyltransferase [Moraxella sp.]